MIWASSSFSAAGPGRLIKVKDTMNAAKYGEIQMQFARELQFEGGKHTAKANTQMVSKQIVHLLEWLSKSSELTPFQNFAKEWGKNCSVQTCTAD